MNAKKQRLINLLFVLNLDYNHPWPNEDGITKHHREKMLEEIQKIYGEINNLEFVEKNQIKPNKKVKVPKYDLITEGFDPSKLTCRCRNCGGEMNVDFICYNCGF